MKKINISTIFITIVSLLLLPIKTKASDGRPILYKQSIHQIILCCHTDTLPPQKKTSTTADGNENEELIKVVPKARRQSIPIPIGVQVKPIILIKPKILKPIIKILH